MIKDMKYMMEDIFSNINLPTDKPVNVLEVGTGNGDGTTVYINNILKSAVFDYRIYSYEGINECYNRATSFWNSQFDPRIEIINKFFCDKEDIESMVLPNIIGEGNIMTKEHYTIAVSLNVPVVIVVTKIDCSMKNCCSETNKQITKLLKKYWLVKD